MKVPEDVGGLLKFAMLLGLGPECLHLWTANIFDYLGPDKFVRASNVCDFCTLELSRHAEQTPSA